jgi:hypothetical protein
MGAPVDEDVGEQAAPEDEDEVEQAEREDVEVPEDAVVPEDAAEPEEMEEQEEGKDDAPEEALMGLPAADQSVVPEGWAAVGLTVDRQVQMAEVMVEPGAQEQTAAVQAAHRQLASR